jgi:predicted amidohydrolase
MLKVRLAQIDWLPDGQMSPALDALRGTEPGALVLLPATLAADAPPAWDSLSEALGKAAAELGVFLAGAAAARDDADAPARHHGFLFAPDGRCVLYTAKSLPDLVGGYREVAGDPGASRSFAAVDTGQGRVGLVIGEDVFAPQLVRATVLSGAELVLNPCIEQADDEFNARLRLKAARAYENSCFLASVSPLCSADGIELPAAGVIADPVGTDLVPRTRATFVDASLDIDGLRARRNRVMPPSFPALNRTSLYAREAASRRDSSATEEIVGRAAWQDEGRRRSRERANRDVPALASGSYGVALAQTVMRHVSDLNERDAIVNANIDHALGTIQGFAGMPDVKLVVFPEFAFHGSPFGFTADQWTQIAFRFPGPEIERLAEFAIRNSVYVAGEAFEYDPDWPHRVFNTAFIIDDSGKLIHRYRKIMCADVVGLLPVTTPGGVLSQYIDRYGFEYLFPVARTPLGNLATVICFDINFSETVRALVHRGAEVIIHPTDEPHGPWRAGWEKGRLTRALENRCYILSTAVGGSFMNPADDFPSGFNRGNSKIVDYQGRIQAIIDTPGAVPLHTQIDIEALRRIRADDRRNWVLWDDAGSYADFYAGHAGYPEDLWIEPPMVYGREGFVATQQVLARYRESGVYAAPSCS